MVQFRSITHHELSQCFQMLARYSLRFRDDKSVFPSIKELKKLWYFKYAKLVVTLLESYILNCFSLNVPVGCDCL